MWSWKFYLKKLFRIVQIIMIDAASVVLSNFHQLKVLAMIFAD